jgi:hypothetical protein
MNSADELVTKIEQLGGWILFVAPDRVRFELPAGNRDLAEAVRQNKPAVLEVLKQRGGWVGDAGKMKSAATDFYWRTPDGKLVNAFPHCPACMSYALYRENNIGNYECLTSGLQNIEESTARRLM